MRLARPSLDPRESAQQTISWEIVKSFVEETGRPAVAPTRTPSNDGNTRLMYCVTGVASLPTALLRRSPQH